jgi:hypothetical protein
MADRASAYGIDAGEKLEEFYRNRPLLRQHVLPRVSLKRCIFCIGLVGEVGREYCECRCGQRAGVHALRGVMSLNGPPLHAELIAPRIGAHVLMALRTLRDAYSLDARPIVALARCEAGGAIDPIAAFRESGWRREKASARKSTSRAAGIV